MSNFNEIESVKAAIQRYINGTHAGDVELLKTVFHEKCVFAGYRGDKFVCGDLSPFYARLSKPPTIRDQGIEFKAEITSLVIDGATASVTLEESGYYGLDVNDYFHLVKVNGEWKIVSKVFQLQN